MGEFARSGMDLEVLPQRQRQPAADLAHRDSVRTESQLIVDFS